MALTETVVDTAVGDLLTVEGLTVAFGHGRQRREVVHRVSFTLRAGESLALVGESGSGKSVIARSLVGLAGPGSRVRAERLEYGRRPLQGLSEREWRGLRGRGIGFVLQDALVSLDPLRRVASEVAEPLRLHRSVAREQIADRVVELLRDVGVPEPELRARQYPHELSGGLRQRALIASAIACEPSLLIADEPTTALDALVQRQVLDLLTERQATGTGLLLISHDLSVVARLADRTAVIQAGRIVEHGATAALLADPQHPYTRSLLAAVPGRAKPGERLSAVRPAGETAVRSERATSRGDDDVPILEVRDVAKQFAGPGATRRQAVDGVSLAVRPGRTVGLVGESGSGKSTVARLVLGLEQPDSGEVLLRGEPWSSLPEAARRPLRPRLQAVFQDPLSSFDPRHTVRRIMADSLRVRGVLEDGIEPESLDLLAKVGLAAELLDRRPLRLSGGQRQRVAIARALATRPDVIVCDEPVSALDVSVQAQVLDLLADLQREFGIAYLFISHDLGVIRHLSDQVLVMKAGRIVESGDTERVFNAPEHPYTQALLEAVNTI